MFTKALFEGLYSRSIHNHKELGTIQNVLQLVREFTNYSTLIQWKSPQQ